MNVHIRTIRLEDYPSVRDLHRNHYWRSHCLILNQDFYNWQFIEHPNIVQAGGDQSIVAVGENGELLSYLGVVPMPAMFRGSQINAAHILTWLSPPEARGQGIGRKLMTQVTKKFNYLFSRSPLPASLPIFQRLRFRYFSECSRWIAVLDPELTFALAANPSDLTLKRARDRAVKIDLSTSYNVSDVTPSGAGAFAKATLTGGLAFLRTNDYFIWRYQKHPFFKYKFIFLGEAEELEGIAVVRIEQSSGRIGKVLRIVEFIATDNKKHKLAMAVMEYGIINGCAYADLFGMSEYYVSGFVSAGGFNAAEEDHLLLPHLLQPWSPEIKPPGVLFWGNQHISASDSIGMIDDMTKIYMSKGDGNLDWPSWVPNAHGNSYALPTKLAQSRP